MLEGANKDFSDSSPSSIFRHKAPMIKVKGENTQSDDYSQTMTNTSAQEYKITDLMK